jgi:single-stranded-DNA-specific exonuclease
MPPAAAKARGLTHLWTYRDAAQPVAAGDLVARILAARRIAQDDAGVFLDPSLKHLCDPSLMPDLDAAARRILDAAARGERVIIYGDYDVDGITATSILYHTIRAIAPGVDLDTYVPHRLEEGYGLNSDAIRQIAAEGARLAISVDCGVTAIEPARAARECGLDLIITDHHNPPHDSTELPDAVAIVHPRRPGSGYPFAHLSGAGVAYKLAWRLFTMHAGATKLPPEHRELLLALLAFAALGTIADVVPLVGENRVLARFGLGRIKHSPFPGLRALVEAAGLAGENVDSEHVGFALGPRLNAAGRMGHAREAVELFTTATGDRAGEIARNLTRLNNDRRATEHRIADQAAELAEARGMTGPDRRAIVLAHDDWHQGVVGIVCSRLVDRFCRPTILMQRRDGRCHGSGRSIRGFSLHAALARCSSRLVRFGGHDMAAGLEVEEHALEAFADDFITHANGCLGEDDLVARLTLDCDAAIADLTTDAVTRLESLAPFGMENPRPKVRLRSLRLTSRAMPLGAGGKHAAITVMQDGRGLRMVGWNWAERLADLPAGIDLDAVVSPKVSRWNGRVNVEPEIVDLMPH